MNGWLILYNGIVSNHGLPTKNTKMLAVGYSMCHGGNPQRINKYCKVLTFLVVPRNWSQDPVCKHNTDLCFDVLRSKLGRKGVCFRKYKHIFSLNVEFISTLYNISEHHYFYRLFHLIWFLLINDTCIYCQWNIVAVFILLMQLSFGDIFCISVIVFEFSIQEK